MYVFINFLFILNIVLINQLAIRYGITVAMDLFIDCHFLFEVQLLCLSLHIRKTFFVV